MAGCFPLFTSRSSRSGSARQRQTPAAPAHPSCAHCGKWALEPSDDKVGLAPPSYDSSSSPIVSNDVSSTIHQTMQSLSSDLRALSLDVHAHPEVGFQEHETHDILVRFMQQQKGWKVTPHAFGLDTAWSAVFTHVPSGSRVTSDDDIPTVGFNSEEDALPGIGHACGHNLIAIGGVGAALSVAAALRKHDILGRIHLIGTPAEEGGGGKIILLQNGAYKNLSACFMIHPYIASTLGSMIAVVPITVKYKGQGAHAGAAPWEGVNAQDAAVLAYNNISALRQQLHPSVRVHGIIQGNNWAPNVIPSESTLVYNIRTTKAKGQLQPVKERVSQCFKAAALATGCEVEIEEGLTYQDVLQQSTFKQMYGKYMQDQFQEEFGSETATASTDFGNVCYTVPSLHPLYRIPVAEPLNRNGNHTPGFTDAAKTPEAHALTLNAAEGIAVLGVKVLADQQFRRDVWSQWEQEVK